MAKDDSNTGRWVDQRLATLDAGDWDPDPARGLDRLRERRRIARRHRIEWAAASLAGIAACVLLVILQAPGACASPRGCLAQVTHTAKPAVAQNPADTPSAAFKQSGSPTAPIVCELYTDYECPSCALLYKETIPLLTEQYVNTGKVRLVHRDFPLPQHPYSRLAARYANAAGSIGQYLPVVEQLFRNQPVWSQDGNVDGQVDQVLTPAQMQKVREIIASGPQVDNTVAADLKMATVDRVNQTPTLVIVFAGKRQPIAGVPQWNALQAYLDELLAR